MTDPRRLVDGSDLGATLLASASADAPGRNAHRRITVALGLAASVTSASSATGSTSEPRAVGTAKVGSRVVGGPTGASTWFTLVGGALVAASVAGGLVLATGGSHPPQPSQGEKAAPPAAATPSGTPVLETTVANERPISAAAAAVPGQGGADQGKGRVPRAIADPSAESRLARELRVLDTARSALERRDIGDALGALDRYDRSFPTGTLRTEATLLRVEALLARGDAAEARKLARDLLARDPAGPHARRLRTIVDNQ